MRPDIGHAEAGYLPDRSWVVWSFVRGHEKVVRDNPQIFLKAAEHCYEKLLLAFGQQSSRWNEIEDRVRSCLKIPKELAAVTADEEIDNLSPKRWIQEFPQYFPSEELSSLEYSPLNWRLAAFKVKNPSQLEWDEWNRGWASRLSFETQENFFSSDWVKFHRAALLHRTTFAEMNMRASPCSHHPYESFLWHRSV